MRKNRFKINYFNDNDGRHLYDRSVSCWTVKQAREIAERDGLDYKITVYQRHYKPYRVLKRYMILDALFDLLFLPLTAFFFGLRWMGNGFLSLVVFLEDLTKDIKYNVRNFFLDSLARSLGWDKVLERQLK